MEWGENGVHWPHSSPSTSILRTFSIRFELGSSLQEIRWKNILCQSKWRPSFVSFCKWLQTHTPTHFEFPCYNVCLVFVKSISREFTELPKFDKYPPEYNIKWATMCDDVVCLLTTPNIQEPIWIFKLHFVDYMTDWWTDIINRYVSIALPMVFVLFIYLVFRNTFHLKCLVRELETLIESNIQPL